MLSKEVKAVNKKTGNSYFFDFGDMYLLDTRWEEKKTIAIDDPEEPESLNKIMLLRKDFDFHLLDKDRREYSLSNLFDESSVFDK